VLKPKVDRPRGELLLFADARAHIQTILELIDSYNEVRQAIEDLGYVIPGEKKSHPSMRVPYLGLHAQTGRGFFDIEDCSLLDEFFDAGPVKKRELRVARPTPTLAARRRLGKENGWACFYCSETGNESHGPDGRVWHVDHAYSVADGGDNQPDNLVLSCATCNLDKKAKSALQFLKERLRLANEKLKAVGQ
jgi:hypothetical protein